MMKSYAVLDLTKCLVNDQECTSYRSIKNISLPDATSELNKLSTYKMISPIQTNVEPQEPSNLISDDMAIVTPSKSVETKKSNESIEPSFSFASPFASRVRQKKNN